MTQKAPRPTKSELEARGRAVWAQIPRRWRPIALIAGGCALLLVFAAAGAVIAACYLLAAVFALIGWMLKY